MACNKYYEKHSEILDDTILVQSNAKKPSITAPFPEKNQKNNNKKTATNIILAPRTEM